MPVCYFLAHIPYIIPYHTWYACLRESVLMFGAQSKTCLLHSALYHVRLALLFLVNYVGMLSTSLYTTYYQTRWLIAIADIYTEYIGHTG